MEKQNKQNETENDNSAFPIKKYISKCISNWYWFLISVIILVALAYYKVKTTEPVFQRYTEVLIEDQDMGAGADITSTFSKMGLVSSNTNVENELISFTSPAVMYEVVKRLDLTTAYTQIKSPHNVTLYGSNQPFIIEVPDLPDTQPASMKVDYAADGSAKIYDIKTSVDGEQQEFDNVCTLKAGTTQVRTPLGRVNIVNNPKFIGKKQDQITVQIVQTPLLECVEDYTSRLKGGLVNRDADVIELKINDTNIEQADDILSTVIAVYNENWVKNKNRTAIATSSFIDERLKVIEQELGVVDSDISKFKSEHMTPDLEMTAQQIVRQSGEYDTELIRANNELAMTGYVYDFLRNPANSESVIPMNTGIGSSHLEGQIANYNTMLLTRNNLAANSSRNNPLVQEYDNQLKGMREAIIQSVASQRTSMATAVRNIEAARGYNNSMLSSAPTQAKNLLSAERQQKIKEELYLYLLQKREENELNQAFTAYNTRIITPPTGPTAPNSPKKKVILLIAFVFGLALPAAVFYILVASDTKIRSRKDLEDLNVPFAGEIPMVGKINPVKKLLRTKKQAKKDLETARIVVKEGNRDVINEAFRVVRSNLNMMFGKDDKCPVVLFTSFNPGSGKSFISYNMALAFELKKKRVLVIDTDLRHGSASNFVGKPRHGLSDYLLEHTDDWHSLVVKNRDEFSPEVMPIGKMPPNPAELLENGRLGTLIKEAREIYDLIILDCPPIDIVVDTQIVEEYADRTVFVVRAGLLDRSALVEIQEIYDNKRFKRMSVLLNGTDTKFSRYHTYGNYQNLEADRG